MMQTDFKNTAVVTSIKTDTYLLQNSFAKQRPHLSTYSTTMSGVIGNGVGLKISMRIPWR